MKPKTVTKKDTSILDKIWSDTYQVSKFKKTAKNCCLRLLKVN